MTESSDYESVQVFIGVDVGKDTHHAVAINRSGKRLFDKALPNDENKLMIIEHTAKLKILTKIINIYFISTMLSLQLK